MGREGYLVGQVDERLGEGLVVGRGLSVPSPSTTQMSSRGRRLSGAHRRAAAAGVYGLTVAAGTALGRWQLVASRRLGIQAAAGTRRTDPRQVGARQAS